MAQRRSTETKQKPYGRTAEETGAVRIWLLGGFRVSVGGKTIEEEAWRLKKASGLVKLLALAPRHRMHRERAM